MQHAIHSETLNLPLVAAIGFLLTLLPLPIMDIFLMTFHVCLHLSAQEDKAGGS